jgi:hypothetical protein
MAIYSEHDHGSSRPTRGEKVLTIQVTIKFSK